MYNQAWVIVKHASNEYWSTYWKRNVKEYGVTSDQSAHASYTAKQCGVDLWEAFDRRDTAQKFCDIMNEHNPCGGYAVCPLIIKGRTA